MLFPSRSPLNALSHQELQAIAADDPLLYAAIKQRMEILREQDEKERCENSLVDFLSAAWEHIGEAGSFIVNWHHEIIANNLERVSLGEIKSLIINEPP